MERKLEILRSYCEDTGRPYEHIEKTTLGNMYITYNGRNGTLSPKAAIDHFAALAEMGIDQAIFSMPNLTDMEPFDLLATQVVPTVANIPVAGR